MMNRLILILGVALFALALCSVEIGCTKEAASVHDTTTVIKHDTTTRIDTVIQKIDTPNLQNGLLVYLKFNGNFADSSGNNNPTQAVNGALLTNDERGVAGSAFGGTGNGERVLVTNNGSIKFDTAFSLSYHVMVTNYAYTDFVTMTQNATGQGVTFGTGMLPGANHLDFAVMDSTAGCSDIINPGVNALIDTSNFVIQPNIWYNVICIFHKGTTQVYVQGNLVTQLSGANKTVPICPSAKVIVGGWWDGAPSNSLNGKLDEVRLYNRVLSAKEIALLSGTYQSATTGSNGGVRSGKDTWLH
jgi:hypothetical protein